MAASGIFVECFERLEDPRMVNKCRHGLMDIVVIAVCATIANADSWDAMAGLRKSALTLVRQHPDLRSFKGKHYQAAWNEDSRADVLKSSFNLMR